MTESKLYVKLQHQLFVMSSLPYEYRLPTELIHIIFDYEGVLVPRISKYFHELWLRKTIIDSTEIFPKILSLPQSMTLSSDPQVDLKYRRAIAAFCYGDEWSLSIIDKHIELPCSIIIQAMIDSAMNNRRLDEHTKASMVRNLLSKPRLVDIDRVKTILCNEHAVRTLISNCNDEVSDIMVKHPDMLACLINKDVMQLIVKVQRDTNGRLIGLLSGHFGYQELLNSMFSPETSDPYITMSKLRQILRPLAGMTLQTLIEDVYSRGYGKTKKHIPLFISLSQYAIERNVEITIDFWDSIKYINDDVDLRILYKVKPYNIEGVVRRLPLHRKVEFCYVVLELDTKKFIHSLHHYLFKYKNISNAFMFHPLCVTRMKEEPELYIRKCVAIVYDDEKFNTLCRILGDKVPENVLDILYAEFPMKYRTLSKPLVEQDYKLSKKTVMTHTDESHKKTISDRSFDYESITPYLSSEDLLLLGVELNPKFPNPSPQADQVAQLPLPRFMQQQVQLPAYPGQPIVRVPYSCLFPASPGLFPGQPMPQLPQVVPGYPGLFPGQPMPQQGFPQIGWQDQLLGAPQQLPLLPQPSPPRDYILSPHGSPDRY